MGSDRWRTCRVIEPLTWMPLARCNSASTGVQAIVRRKKSAAIDQCDRPSEWRRKVWKVLWLILSRGYLFSKPWDIWVARTLCRQMGSGFSTLGDGPLSVLILLHFLCFRRLWGCSRRASRFEPIITWEFQVLVPSFFFKSTSVFCAQLFASNWHHCIGLEFRASNSQLQNQQLRW